MTLSVSVAMRSWLPILAFLGLGGAISARAETPQAWRVDGAISGRSFALDCRFEKGGGVCIDAASGGQRSHPLISLSSSGDRISWSFNTRVVLANIRLAFDGRIAGNRMEGTVKAAGRTGTFVAARR